MSAFNALLCKNKVSFSATSSVVPKSGLLISSLRRRPVAQLLPGSPGWLPGTKSSEARKKTRRFHQGLPPGLTLHQLSGIPIPKNFKQNDVTRS